MCWSKPKAPDDPCWGASQPFAGPPPGAKDPSFSRADAQPQRYRGNAKRVGSGLWAATSPLPGQGQSAIAELFDWSGVQRQTVDQTDYLGDPTGWVGCQGFGWDRLSRDAVCTGSEKTGRKRQKRKENE